MANDDDDLRPAGGAGDPAAVAMAMNAESSTAEARAYLREQTDLARLQKLNLVEQNQFELSHLRFRRFADWGKFALQIGVGLILLLIVTALGAMVWNAARDKDLVVESFSVPPDVAQSGMTGGVLAARVLDRLGRMQADTFSITQGAGRYHRSNEEQVRVEIPDTGISIQELDRYLRQWLGHETHVTGDLVHTGKGLAITVRYGEEPGATYEAAATDFDKLIDAAARHLYLASSALRYADYVSWHDHHYSVARVILAPLAASGAARERADAYVGLASNDYFSGNLPVAENEGVAATRLDPDNAATWYVLGSAANELGHDELSYAAMDRIPPLLGRDDELDPDLAAALPYTARADMDEEKGDYQDEIAVCTNPAALAAKTTECHVGSLAGDSVLRHDIADGRRQAALISPTSLSGKPSELADLAHGQIATAVRDWPAAMDAYRRADAIMAARPEVFLGTRRVTALWPPLARAIAGSGDIIGAEALIGKTPLDCDACLRARGRIATLKHDWNGAAHWFAMVSERSPDIPFADTDWGQLLLDKGDFDGAIAKFESANKKGPHFADPLEMWGEALIAKNRSDLALAKFEEASKYAPNWGRLHLKWGEALLWSGDKAGAQKQFATAAHLDLSPSEKSERARVSHG
jgi:tetratricopeptide (TPR) repeat protein